MISIPSSKNSLKGEKKTILSMDSMVFLDFQGSKKNLPEANSKST